MDPEESVISYPDQYNFGIQELIMVIERLIPMDYSDQFSNLTIEYSS